MTSVLWSWEGSSRSCYMSSICLHSAGRWWEQVSPGTVQLFLNARNAPTLIFFICLFMHLQLERKLTKVTSFLKKKTHTKSVIYVPLVVSEGTVVFALQLYPVPGCRHGAQPARQKWTDRTNPGTSWYRHSAGLTPPQGFHCKAKTCPLWLEREEQGVCPSATRETLTQRPSCSGGRRQPPWGLPTRSGECCCPLKSLCSSVARPWVCHVSFHWSVKLQSLKNMLYFSSWNNRQTYND